MKDGDYIEHLFVCSTHDYLLFFSNRGKVYRSKVYELPEASRTAKGRALVNLLPLREGERIQSVLSTRDFTEGKYLVFATRSGMVKKTEFLAYNTPIKADGIIAINIRDDDELVAVRRDDRATTRSSWSRARARPSRFHEDDAARRWAATPRGVRGMDVSRQGRRGARDGRRARRPGAARRHRERLRQAHARSTEYRKTNRGAKGVETIKLTEAKGALAGALVVREHQELVFISQSGMVQRTGVRGISRYGRASQGVRRHEHASEDDASRAVALVVESEAERRAERRRSTTTPPPSDGDAESANGAVPEAAEPAGRRHPGATTSRRRDRSRAVVDALLPFAVPEKGGGPYL